MINNNTQTKSLTKYKTKANTSTIKDIDTKEDYLFSRDDKTVDSTLPNKLHRNSSHGTFSINKLNISGSFQKPLKANKKINNKLINDYLLSISKDFWHKDIQQQKEEFYQNYENNINMFEGWIQQIKGEGFDQNKKELNNKKRIVSNLEEKVSNMKKQLIYSKKGMGDKDVRLMKLKATIQQEKDIAEKNKAERAIMAQELNDLRKDGLLIPSQTECTKEETRILNEKLTTERNNVLKLYSDIQQCNAKITNITKEKETLQTSLKILKKQIEAYRLKIMNTYQKGSNFMLDVNNLINNNELFLK